MKIRKVTLDQRMTQLREVFGEDIRVVVDVTEDGTRLNAAERIDKSDGIPKKQDAYEVLAEDDRPHYMG